MVFAPDRGTATKVRARHPAARVVVAGEPLPVTDAVFDELVDERATGPSSVEEDARVVRPGGRLALVSDLPPGGGLAAALGGLFKRSRHPIAPTDASAWLLGAGCAELTQHPVNAGALRTEGLVRR